MSFRAVCIKPTFFWSLGPDGKVRPAAAITNRVYGFDGETVYCGHPAYTLGNVRAFAAGFRKLEPPRDTNIQFAFDILDSCIRHARSGEEA